MAALRQLAEDTRRGLRLVGGPLVRHRLAALVVVVACVVSAVVTSIAVEERYTTATTVLLAPPKGETALAALGRRVLRTVEQPEGTRLVIGREPDGGRPVVVATGPDGPQTSSLSRAAAIQLVVTQLGVDERTLALRAAAAERAAAALPAGTGAAVELRRLARVLRKATRRFHRLWVVGPTVRVSGSQPWHDGIVALALGLALATAVAVGLDGLSRGAPHL